MLFRYNGLALVALEKRMSSEPKGTVYPPFKLVGCSFVKPGYPENLHRIHDEIEARKVASLGWGDDVPDQGDPEPVSLLLIRRPTNEYDANAIEVHCPALGRRSMIGHIDRERAAKMAPHLDSGWYHEAEVVSVNILPDKPNQPGLTLSVTLTPEASDTQSQ